MGYREARNSIGKILERKGRLGHEEPHRAEMEIRGKAPRTLAKPRMQLDLERRGFGKQLPACGEEYCSAELLRYGAPILYLILSCSFRRKTVAPLLLASFWGVGSGVGESVICGHFLPIQRPYHHNHKGGSGALHPHCYRERRGMTRRDLTRALKTRALSTQLSLQVSPSARSA